MVSEYVQGLPQLQARMRAITPQKSGLMQKLAFATVAEAKRLVPRKTGNLGRSIHVVSFSATEARVEASAKYAVFVERGTKAHEITPKARKALRFAATAAGRRLTGTPRKGADVVFAKRVHHPGTKPQPFMLPGAQKAIQKAGLASQIVKDWNAAA